MTESRRTELIRCGIRIVQTKALGNKWQRHIFKDGVRIAQMTGHYMTVDELEAECARIAGEVAERETEDNGSGRSKGFES